MANKFSGLSFKKMDLHVHTPSSHDFSSGDITPDDIIKVAIDNGMSAIAITDHNTGDYIDQIKERAKDKPLAIFPGVEITCSGGANGIHVIAIFDCDKGTDHINSLLSKLNILGDKRGKKETVTEKSVSDVISIIGELDGIAILAHCTSSKGVLNEIKGEQRSLIFKNTELLAVETSAADFSKDVGKRTIDFLNGTDANYNNRKLAVYIASDSRIEGEDQHSLNGIGSKYTYFKTDDTITLESLRQCFIDPDVRIVQSHNYYAKGYPYIKSISIDSGFFKSEVAEFHSGLNCILGSKGAGKSLLVELLRFGLSSPPTQKEIKKDHISKLKVRLKNLGTVKVIFCDPLGNKNLIETTFNENEYESSKVENDNPVLFLSQNEIINIAENDAEQIKFIDKFLDFNFYLSKIKVFETELLQLDSQFADSVDAIYIQDTLQKELEKLQKELLPIEQQLKDPRYSEYIKSEKINAAIKTQVNDCQRLGTVIEDIIASLKDFSMVDINDVDVIAEIKRNRTYLNELYNATLESADNLLKKTFETKNKVNEEKKSWDITFITATQKYEEFIKADGDKKDLEILRKRKIFQINEINEKLNLYKTKADAVKSVNERRNQKLKQLDEVYIEYTNERRKKCTFFEQVSNGRLQIALQESFNYEDFKQQMMQLKKGSYFRNNDIETLCERITPKAFVHSLMQYHAFKGNDANRDTVLKNTNEKLNIGVMQIKELFDFLLTQRTLLELLKMQYTARAQDRPLIKFRVAEDVYQPINHISIGQKCTAMLIMALSQGDMPVVIDQPEDSLDIKSIWSDMCLKIRENKEKRQFIFTTHNSSLAVASDTDKYIIVEGNAETGKIVKSGAIDTDFVKAEVIDYLEGSSDTYYKKYDKYNIER